LINLYCNEVQSQPVMKYSHIQ